MGCSFSTVRVGPVEAAQVALVFIKPHANTPEVQAEVKRMLQSAGISIISESSVDGPTIEKRGLIDNHYHAIASKAVLQKPTELNVPHATFKEFFQEEWSDVTEEGRAFNAIDVQAHLGIDEKRLDDLWSEARRQNRVVKLGGGFQCGLIDVTQRIYTFNAFFMSLRAEYTAPTATLALYEVQLPPKMRWADFRAKLIGPTDPTQASPKSVRGTIFARWRELGLTAAPDKGNNVRICPLAFSLPSPRLFSAHRAQGATAHASMLRESLTPFAMCMCVCTLCCVHSVLCALCAVCTLWCVCRACTHRPLLSRASRRGATGCAPPSPRMASPRG